MARHKRHEVLEDKPPELDISSMIDLVFMLLLYFMVATSLQPRETDLGMKLPAGVPSGEQPVIDPMFIRVDAPGAIYAGVGNSQQVLDTDTGERDVPLLSSQLKLYADAARASASTPLVQIYVDGGANQQRVIDVLNALAGADITSVTFTDLVD